MVQNSFFGWRSWSSGALDLAFRIWDPATEFKSRYLNRMSACRTSEVHAELHERAPNSMSAAEPHEHGRIASPLPPPRTTTTWNGLDSDGRCLDYGESSKNRMGIGEPPCAYGGVNGVTYPRHHSFFCFRFCVGFVSPVLPQSLIQFFSVVLDVRRLPWILVLIQYASAWENVVSIGEPHEHRRIHGNARTPIRIWRSQWSHIPLHRSFFCFRYVVCFIPNSVLFRRSWMYAIFREWWSWFSTHRAWENVVSMGERCEHERTSWAWENRMGMRELPCAYGGVNGVTFRFIVHSSAWGTSSASSLIQFFSAVLNVRHIPRMVVLIQYAAAWENVVSIRERCEHQRIAWEWDNRTRIWGSQ